MNLVVGASGVLGTEICKLLTERGKPVRALIRSTTSEEKKSALQKLRVEFVEGDLKDHASLQSACRNVENILTTATSIVARQAGDSFDRTDRDGHFALIDAAEKAGVKRFVFISFPPSPVETPLQSAKRAVEDRLKKSSLAYTILQPTLFQEVWLGPHLGFDAAKGNVRIYGTGEKQISWISYRDVGQFAVLSLENTAAENSVIPLGGPESLTPLEVVKIFEEISGKTFTVEHVPADALKSQYESAVDPVQRTFTGLMLGYTQGTVIGMQEVLQSMPVKLRSVRDYASSIKM